jgi:hypothetical protein
LADRPVGTGATSFATDEPPPAAPAPAQSTGDAGLADRVERLEARVAALERALGEPAGDGA